LRKYFKQIIEFDYSDIIIQNFVNNLYNKDCTNLEPKDLINYVYFLNFISCDKFVIFVINNFNKISNYKNVIGYVLEIIYLFPQYFNLIQKK
jgi:hypothetical protein